MSSSDLPPIDIKEDVERYEAVSESKEVKFQGCRHKQASYDKTRGELRCTCGASWSGERLNELLEALKLDKS